MFIDPDFAAPDRSKDRGHDQTVGLLPSRYLRRLKEYKGCFNSLSRAE
jgi:hypothetical protein